MGHAWAASGHEVDVVWGLAMGRQQVGYGWAASGPWLGCKCVMAVLRVGHGWAASGPWVGCEWALSGPWVGGKWARSGPWVDCVLTVNYFGKAKLNLSHIPRSWWAIKSRFCPEFVHVLNLSRFCPRTVNG